VFLHKYIGDHAIAIQIGLLVQRLLVQRLHGHRGHLVDGDVHDPAWQLGSKTE